MGDSAAMPAQPGVSSADVPSPHGGCACADAVLALCAQPVRVHWEMSHWDLGDESLVCFKSLEGDSERRVRVTSAAGSQIVPAPPNPGTYTLQFVVRNSAPAPARVEAARRLRAWVVRRQQAQHRAGANPAPCTCLLASGALITRR